MHNVQRDGAGCASVYTTLNDNPPKDGFLAHVTRRLFGSGQRPLLIELTEDVVSQAKELASSAPPHVLYPVIANVRLTREVALVELPGAKAVYAEREGDSLCVCVLRAEGPTATFRPVAGRLRLPTVRPEVDWEAVDARTWALDVNAHMVWEAWAAENMAVVPLRGTTPPTETETARVLQTQVLPSLAALALATSPIVDVEPTAWIRIQGPTKG
ncbi:hypothetical protein [Roseomonas sp. 18066]|uniref:hypothetical protein n=1 Tax=Roseomonas sp. 18066 TaxID=2681412 RepID=UPI001357A8C5|nr:hypothetical protein [Roseomonas sp. 18066]